MTVRYTPSTAVRPVPEVTPFFHEASHTWTYLVVDSATSRCAIVDPVMDFDPALPRPMPLLPRCMAAV